MSIPRKAGLAGAAVFTALALVGCGSDGDEPEAGAPAATGVPTTTGAPSPSGASPSAAAPFGPACAGLPAAGPGSPQQLAGKPVATAAADSPALSTLATAVKAAGLVETLNGARGITVFAPTNDAFAKIPKATLDQVLADKQALTKILTYHVVEQRRGPADLGGEPLTTLQGGTITTARSGETYTANDARVVCGNVQTSNATVYLIDTVLMPKN